jgi:methylglyoxal reductase
MTGLEKRTLGATGIETTALGVGCWAIGGEDFNLGVPMGWSGTDESRSLAGLERAYEMGVNLFDTADVYGHGRSERLLGLLIGQVPRPTVVVSSKVGYFAGTASHGYEPQHMRHQLEQSLTNLGTDYLDIYFLHHAEFGPSDRYLPGAIKTIHAMKDEGLIRAVGMRGPHRFALERLSTPAELRGDKVARFRALFDEIMPDVIAVRDNLLSPGERSAGIFAFADAHDCGILINKPLAQGLLSGAHLSAVPRVYGPGDHRRRKRWFTPEALAVIESGLDQLRNAVGIAAGDLIRTALSSCLMRSERASVLVGFTCPEQIEENVTCLSSPPTAREIEMARQIMTQVQQLLDASGEVFVDE